MAALLNLLQYAVLGFCIYLGYISYDRDVILVITAALILLYIPQRAKFFAQLYRTSGIQSLLGACITMIVVNVILSVILYYIGYGARMIF